MNTQASLKDLEASNSPESQLEEYRKLLSELESGMQKSFDQSILTISAGALGLSLAFLKDVIGDRPLQCPSALILAWISWSLSITCIIASFLTSVHAIRKTRQLLDDKAPRDALKSVGLNRFTMHLNLSAGALFIVGVTFLLVFVGKNVKSAKREQTRIEAEFPSNPSQPTKGHRQSPSAETQPFSERDSRSTTATANTQAQSALPKQE